VLGDDAACDPSAWSGTFSPGSRQVMRSHLVIERLWERNTLEATLSSHGNIESVVIRMRTRLRQARRSRVITSLAAGGERTATTTYGYDAIGRRTATTESGTGVPDVCTVVHYAENTTTSWIRDRVSETITSQQACPAPGIDPSPTLSATRTYYDNSTTLGAVPGAGNATCTEKTVSGIPSAQSTCDGSTTSRFAKLGTTVYDPLGRITSATDANQHTTNTAYTPADGGIVAKVVVTNPKNQTTTTELEPSRGLTTGTVDVGGRRSDANYDALGRVTEVWKPGRAKGRVTADVTYAYLQRIDGPLAVTTKTLVDYGTGTNYVTSIKLFDAFGQLRQTQTDDVSNPGGVSSRVMSDVFYDSHGWAIRSNNRYVIGNVPATNLVAIGDSEIDDRTITEYDGAGRPVKSLSYQRLNKKWESRTIYGGDRTTVIPPLGGVTATAISDVRGRNTEIRQYTSAPIVTGSVVSGGTFEPTTLRYNALGQLDGMTDAAHNTWSYGYDMLGHRTTVTDPDAGTTTSTYDLTGLLTSTTDARGQVLTYAYDELGRKTAQHSGSLSTPPLAEWFYDTTPGGVGLPASSVRHTAKGDYQVGVSHYNSAGLPSENMVQIPTGETGLAGTYTTTTSYTSTGLPRVISQEAVGGLPYEDLVIAYDRYGQPKSTLGENSIVSASTYTAYGEPIRYTLGINSLTASLAYGYDSHTRALTQAILSSQQAFPQIDALNYTRDLVGNITKIVNVQGDPNNDAPTRTQCFTYDALNRLTQAWTATNDCTTAPSTATVGGVTPYWTTWDIDKIGLRRSQTRHAVGGGQNTTTTYTYPASGADAVRPHALSSTTTTGPTGTSSTSYGYNAVGDVTTRELPTGDQTLTWNENNQVATITTPTSATAYTYDADGNQLIRSDPDTTTLYLPGQDIVRDNTSGIVTGTRYYTHNGTTVAMRIAGNNPRYLQTDQHGTGQVTATTPDFTVSRRTFDPYGNPIGIAQGVWPDQRGFLNMPHNPVTGLTDIGARKYDPTTGAFISVDPVLDTANPQQWNPYAYSNNNPVTNSDPTGLYCDSCNFYPDNLGGPEVGVGCPPCSSNPHQAQDDYEIKTGQNKDPSKQPTVVDRRLPTFDELKQRPGFAHYMESGTYDDAIADWAKGICSHAIPEDDQFCNAAKSYGLLEVEPGVVKFMRVVSLAVVLAPLVIECLASELCSAIAGGVADAVTPEGAAFGAYGAGRLVDDALDLGRAACSFTGDTKILMADGTHKPIRDVKVGDEVRAADPETGKSGTRTVTAAWHHQDIVLKLVTEDGATVTTTEDHPYWNSTDQQWQQAQELDPGDILLAANGRTVRASGLRADTVRTAMAFTLSVDDLHTYYVLVGDAPVLVHNCPASKALNSAEQATLARMDSIFPSEGLRGVNAPDADFVGKSGKFDAMGAPGAFQNWDRQRRNFLAQIPRHANKSDFAIVDMTGASRGQIDDVMSYYGTLGKSIQNRVIVIDGTKILN